MFSPKLKLKELFLFYNYVKVLLSYQLIIYYSKYNRINITLFAVLCVRTNCLFIKLAKKKNIDLECDLQQQIIPNFIYDTLTFRK